MNGHKTTLLPEPEENPLDHEKARTDANAFLEKLHKMHFESVFDVIEFVKKYWFVYRQLSVTHADNLTHPDLMQARMEYNLIATHFMHIVAQHAETQAAQNIVMEQLFLVIAATPENQDKFKEFVLNCTKNIANKEQAEMIMDRLFGALEELRVEHGLPASSRNLN